MSTPEAQDDDLIECPCCHGKKYLLTHTENEPPQKVKCIHCDGFGKIAPDNRSMNQYE